MYKVQIKWSDGTVTTDLYNDPSQIGCAVTRKQLEEAYTRLQAESNENIKYFNIQKI